MLDGLRFRSKTILKITPDGDGFRVHRAPTKVHLMERPSGRKTRAKKTICGMKIGWRPFGQSLCLDTDATCLRCLGRLGRWVTH